MASVPDWTCPTSRHAIVYAGLDLTAAMLRRAKPRSAGLHLDLVQGDSMSLPFTGECFDHAVLHLILAAIPNPLACLRETARVVKPGGSIVILDKFLKPDETAWIRRTLNLLAQHTVTRLDVVFEEVLAGAPRIEAENRCAGASRRAVSQHPLG